VSGIAGAFVCRSAPRHSHHASEIDFSNPLDRGTHSHDSWAAIQNQRDSFDSRADACLPEAWVDIKSLALL